MVRGASGGDHARRLVGAGINAIRRLHPGVGITIAAQRRLKDFYASFGFAAVSPVYPEDGIAHIDMVLEPTSATCHTVL